jgi:hypothetical protein
MNYMLEITTWENDGDCYNMKSLKNLSKDHTEFYIRIAKMFYSAHSYRNEPSGFGSTGVVEMDEEVTAAIDKVILEFLADGKSVPEYWYTPPEERDAYFNYEDFLWDMGLGCGYESDYRRVFEKLKVYEVPQELKDVTSEFVD